MYVWQPGCPLFVLFRMAGREEEPPLRILRCQRAHAPHHHTLRASTPAQQVTTTRPRMPW
ncbi:hypothetical protein EON67_02480 [archaeon]|nr:MAG: hypothetical protein EON67_02480 [archaeon]